MQNKHGAGYQVPDQEVIDQGKNISTADRFAMPVKEFTSNKMVREAEFETQGRRAPDKDDDVSSLDEEERPPMELFESIFD